jgi:hypothetical protein
MRIVLSMILFCSVFVAGGQTTATNFNVKDCSGTYYELFAELNKGKVVVICWVMPCGPCGPPAKTTYNVVQSYATTHPGRVEMLLVDDFANTTCQNLVAWGNTQGLTNTIAFSDAAINMFDYGLYGMPKVVVIGPKEYKVYDDQIDVVNHAQLQSAITLALSESIGIDSPEPLAGVTVGPNPVSESRFSVYADHTDRVELTLFNSYGQVVLAASDLELVPGSPLWISREGLPAGVYTLRISGSGTESTLRIVML